MKKAARIVASLILAGAMSAVAMADNDFEFKGYARAGLLMDTKLANQGDFNIRNVGRLGNENSSPYMEAEMIKTMKAGKNWAKYHVMMAQGTGNTADWVDGLAVRQTFVEMGGFGFAPKATIWAGKRFYGRDDIHITDLYWRDMSGTGAGVTGLVDGNLDLALVKRGDDATAIDARYRFGAIEAEGTVHYLNDGADGDADTAFQVAGVYSMPSFFGVASGFAKAAVQVGINYNNKWDLGTSRNKYADGATSLRGLVYGTASMGENWQMMSSVVFETCDNDNADKADQFTMLSLVARPEYKINDNFMLAFEAGLASFDNAKDDVSGLQYKLTVAPTLKLDANGFWNRPELRAFVTYVGQDEELGDVAEEIRIGTQAEVWF